MFSITGTVVKVFKAPEGKTKTGESYGGDYRVQVMGELSLKNGEFKNELVTLGMPSKWDRELFKCIGSVVTLPVGLMVSGNAVKAFIPETAIIPKEILTKDAKKSA